MLGDLQNGGRPTLDALRAEKAAAALGADRDISEDFGAQMDALLTPATGAFETEPELPRREVLLALRLAASLGAEARARVFSQPAAVTVIEGIPPDDLEMVAALLRRGVLSSDMRVSQNPRAFNERREGLLIVLPDGGGGTSAATASRGLKRSFAAALEAPVGVLVLLPSSLSLDAEILESRATRLEFAPIGRAIMIEYLRCLTPRERAFDVRAIAAALPSDATLAGMSDLALHSALRHPTPLGIARALGAPPSRRSGPRLDEMTGDGEALRLARAMVADLQAWATGKVAWSDLTQSLLLHGLPGTGKTWLARAMGNSPGVGFVSASFPGWQAEGHLGDMLAAMRSTFTSAIRQRPAVLFIDEIDAVGSRGDSDRHGASYRAQVTTGFLQQIDHMMRTQGVLLVGACNAIGRIDPAVLRPGRFDRHVEVPLPDAATLTGLLSAGLGSGIDAGTIATIAHRAVGQSAAAVDAGLRAAKAAARAEGRGLGLADLEAHLPLAPATPARDRRAAVHESGHAIVCTALRFGRMECIRLTPDGGRAICAPSPSESLIGDLEAQICFNLAGRAAERLLFDDVSSGAGGSAASDLACATTMALHIETRLGLGAAGPVWIASPEEMLVSDPDTLNRVQHRLERAEQRALQILRRNHMLLIRMAAVLMEVRSIEKDALQAWLADVEQEPAKREKRQGQVCLADVETSSDVQTGGSGAQLAC